MEVVKLFKFNKGYGVISNGYFIIILLVALILTACENAEFQSKDYPYIITNEVSKLNSKGVTFNAEIISLGNEPIIDCGFIWNGLSYEYSKSIKTKDKIEDFSYRVSEDLEENVKYTYRAYVKTNNCIILGNKIEFKSKGSEIQLIEDFIPKEGFDNSIITIKGKYFSSNILRNNVYINNEVAKVIYSSTDTIIIETPQMAFSGDASLSVQVGGKTVIANHPYKILGPEIESISPMKGYPGDEIIIHGNYLNNNGENLQILFGNYNSELIEASESYIKTKVPIPDNIQLDENQKIKIINGGKTTLEEFIFTIKRSWGEKTGMPSDDSNIYNPYSAFVYQGNAYILAYRGNRFLYKYETLNDTWQIISGSKFPETKYIDESLYIISENNLFKIGGHKFNDIPLNTVWKYNFNTNQWSQAENLPFSFYRAVNFKIDNSDFIITEKGNLWKCDFINYEFIQLNDFPIPLEDNFAFAFFDNTSPYVMAKDKTWQYNSANDTWTEKSQHTFTNDIHFRNAVGFTLNGIGYFIERDKVYKYNNSIHSWDYINKYPGMINEYRTAFIINGKAYIPGFGYSNQRQLYIFYNKI